MSTKAKGSNAERDLIHKFWSVGFAAMRSAGSGSMHYPSPDILAAKNGRTLSIECKVTKDTFKYFDKKEIEDLKQFSEMFHAEPYVALKFKREGWFFLPLSTLEETPKSFRADLPMAIRTGLRFEALVSLI